MASIFDYLPRELWISITDYINIKGIINLTLVCRELYAIIHHINFVTRTRNKYIPYKSDLNGMFFQDIKIIKEKWLNIPICFYLNGYNINYIGLENIFKNYISDVPSIVKIAIDCLSVYKGTYVGDILNVYDSINSIPDTVKCIDFHNNRNPIINEEPPYVFKKGIRELKLNLNDGMDLSLFQINYVNLEVLQLDNINFYSITMSKELEDALSNVKDLTIKNCISRYDLSFLKGTGKLKLYNIWISQDAINSFKSYKCLDIQFDDRSITPEELITLDLNILNTIQNLTIKNCISPVDLSKFKDVQRLMLYSCLSVGFGEETFMNCRVLVLNFTNISNEELINFKFVERLSLTDCNDIDSLEGLCSSNCKVLDISHNKKIKQIDFLTQLDILMMHECSKQIKMRNHMYKLDKVKIITEANEYREYNEVLFQ
jgi:hypothetical protein